MGTNPRDYLHNQPIAGRIALAVTGTYYRNADDVFSETGFFVKSDPANSGRVYFGNTGSSLVNMYPLSAGQEAELNIWNIRLVQFLSTSVTGSCAVHWLKK